MQDSGARWLLVVDLPPLVGGQRRGRTSVGRFLFPLLAARTRLARALRRMPLALARRTALGRLPGVGGEVRLSLAMFCT
ncbi:hypothetical protein CSC46_0708 [Pseudomonas aeruginosa]|nr:hypothetical protein CSC46_0708 [Pseudomonas aeruginosa]